MQAGKLRHRVTIQARPSTQDSSGQRSGEFANVMGPVWGEIKDLGGRELIAAQAIVAEVTGSVTLRGFPGWRTAIKPDMRVIGDGRTFEIKAATNPDGKNIAIQLLTVEIISA